MFQLAHHRAAARGDPPRRRAAPRPLSHFHVGIIARINAEQRRHHHETTGDWRYPEEETAGKEGGYCPQSP